MGCIEIERFLRFCRKQQHESAPNPPQIWENQGKSQFNRALVCTIQSGLPVKTFLGGGGQVQWTRFFRREKA